MKQEQLENQLYLGLFPLWDSKQRTRTDKPKEPSMKESILTLKFLTLIFSPFLRVSLIISLTITSSILSQASIILITFTLKTTGNFSSIAFESLEHRHS